MLLTAPWKAWSILLIIRRKATQCANSKSSTRQLSTVTLEQVTRRPIAWVSISITEFFTCLVIDDKVKLHKLPRISVQRETKISYNHAGNAAGGIRSGSSPCGRLFWQVDLLYPCFCQQHFAVGRCFGTLRSIQPYAPGEKKIQRKEKKKITQQSYCFECHEGAQ